MLSSFLFLVGGADDAKSILAYKVTLYSLFIIIIIIIIIIIVIIIKHMQI
jgi:hypothetical protein